MFEWPNGCGNSIKKFLKSVQIRVNQWLKVFSEKCSAVNPNIVSSHLIFTNL